MWSTIYILQRAGIWNYETVQDLNSLNTENAWRQQQHGILGEVLVKVQFRGPELYKKKGALFQEESYLPRIFRSSSLNLHTFHLIHIVFWWQIFFRKHGKSTPNDREDHHVLVVDVVIMTSQCRCTRALSQSHVAKHDNHVPVAPLIGSGLGVMSMQWLPYGKIISAKTLKLHSNWGHPSTIVSPTCSWRHEDTR